MEQNSQKNKEEITVGMMESWRSIERFEKSEDYKIYNEAKLEIERGLFSRKFIKDEKEAEADSYFLKAIEKAEADSYFLEAIKKLEGLINNEKIDKTIINLLFNDLLLTAYCELKQYEKASKTFKDSIEYFEDFTKSIGKVQEEHKSKNLLNQEALMYKKLGIINCLYKIYQPNEYNIIQEKKYLDEQYSDEQGYYSGLLDKIDGYGEENKIEENKIKGEENKIEENKIKTGYSENINKQYDILLNEINEGKKIKYNPAKKETKKILRAKVKGKYLKELNDEVTNSFEKAIKIYKNDSETFFYQALWLNSIKNYSMAIKCFKNAISSLEGKDKNHYKTQKITYLSNLIIVYNQLDKNTKEKLNKIELKKEKIECLRDLVKLNKEKIECLRDLVKLNPENKMALNRLSSALLDLGFYLIELEENQEAIKIFKEVGLDESALGIDILGIGIAYLKLGDFEKGIESLKKGIELREKITDNGNGKQDMLKAIKFPFQSLIKKDLIKVYEKTEKQNSVNVENNNKKEYPTLELIEDFITKTNRNNMFEVFKEIDNIKNLINQNDKLLAITDEFSKEYLQQQKELTGITQTIQKQPELQQKTEEEKSQVKEIFDHLERIEFLINQPNSKIKPSSLAEKLKEGKEEKQII